MQNIIEKLNKLNRFPKMMILQYCRARKLGFSEGKAKEIGYAEALKYAIFKTRAGWGLSRKGRKGKNNKTCVSQVLLEQILNQNQIYKIFKLLVNNENRIIVGKKMIEEIDFDNELIKKGIGQEELEFLKRFYFDYLNGVDEEILKNESKFFNKVWKKIRDYKFN